MTVAIEMPDEQSFMFDNVSWEFYEHLLREVGDRHIFVTYDRGRLEIMSPSFRHERYAELLGALVRILAAELHALVMLSQGVDETEWALKVREWLRANHLPK